MQRRLIEDLKELEDNIQSLRKKRCDGDLKKYHINVNDENFQRIFEILYKLLSAPDKSFEVVFKGIRYDFVNPTTEQEKDDMHQLRIDLIDTILKECYQRMVDGTDIWWTVTTFASGIDTLDCQVEIIGKEEHANQFDENGERITALPLDTSNYQVKQELENEHISEDQALDIN
jgi:hypothetical protein